MNTKPLDLKGAENICTDPKDPRFFEGTTLEKKLSVLRHLAPEKYDACGVLVLVALQIEFSKILNPGEALRHLGVSTLGNCRGAIIRARSD